MSSNQRSHPDSIYDSRWRSLWPRPANAATGQTFSERGRSTGSLASSSSTASARSPVQFGSRTVFWTLLLILAVGAFLRLYQLGAESFSYDEGIMIDATGSGWSEAWANIARGRPPLIVLVGFGWVNLFGQSELAVRLLPALMSIASIGLLFGIGRDLFGERCGLLGAAIISIAAFHIFHAQDYRYYSLLTLMALLSFAFYIKLLQADQKAETNQWRAWIPYVLFSSLVYYTHYQGIFLLVAQGLFFLTRWLVASPSLRWRWLSSQVAIGLLLLPSLLKVLGDFTAGADSGEFEGSIGAMGNLGPLSDPEIWLPFHTLFVKYFFFSIDNLFNWPYFLAAVGLLAGGLAYRWIRQSSINWLDHIMWLPDNSTRTVLSGRMAFVLLLLWATLPVFLPFILSKIFGPMYLPRYTIGALPAMSLLIALAMLRVPRWVPVWATYGALVILVLPGLQGYYGKDYKDQWRTAALYLASQQPEEEQLLFASVNNETADRIQSLFLRYLEPATHANAARLSEWQGTECVISTGLISPEQRQRQVDTCLVGETHLWLISRPAKEGPQQTVEEALLGSLPPEWEAVDEKVFSGVVLRLFEKE